jgi:hypothetical protein
VAEEEAAVGKVRHEFLQRARFEARDARKFDAMP